MKKEMDGWMGGWVDVQHTLALESYKQSNNFFSVIEKHFFEGLKHFLIFLYIIYDCLKNVFSVYRTSLELNLESIHASGHPSPSPPKPFSRLDSTFHMVLSSSRQQDHVQEAAQSSSKTSFSPIKAA